MELRQMATAFLFYNKRVLMMKKVNSRIHEEPFWTGLGGHLEQAELNDPRRACLREIEEESGITESSIEGLRLRYILLRIKGEEIRQQFVYFGRVTDGRYRSSAEGELSWIEEKDLLHLRTSTIIRFMLEHDMDNRQSEDVMVGTIERNDDNEPNIQWSRLRDPLVF